MGFVKLMLVVVTFLYILPSFRRLSAAQGRNLPKTKLVFLQQNTAVKHGKEMHCRTA